MCFYDLTIMHWGNLWRYIFPATRVGCFLLRLILSFSFRLLRFAQLVDEAEEMKSVRLYNTVSSVVLLEITVFLVIPTQ